MVEAPGPESPDMKRKGVGKRNATYPHTESSSKIIQCHPGARVPRVIHLLECARSKGLTSPSYRLPVLQFVDRLGVFGRYRRDRDVGHVLIWAGLRRWSYNDVPDS